MMKEWLRKIFFLFVNEVEQGEKLQRRCEGENSFQDYLDNEPTMLTFNALSSKEIYLKVDRLNGKYDSKKNIIMDGTFVGRCSEANIALAHHDLVVPGYLIVIQESVSLKTTVEDLFCRVLDGKISTRQINAVKILLKPKHVSRQSEKEKFENFTLRTLISELEKTLVAYQKIVENDFVKKVKCMVEESSFNYVSIFETNEDESYNYKMEVLKTENNDYQFIQSLIRDNNSDWNPKVVNIFKINTVNKNEVSQIQNKELYLYGVRAENINGVLKSSFQNKIFRNFLAATNNFERQYCNGVNYCNVDKKIKNYSFVFVTSSMFINRIGTGSYSFRNNTYRTARYHKVVLTSTVPEYLMVLEA